MNKNLCIVITFLFLVLGSHNRDASAQNDPKRLLQTIETDSDRFNQSLNSALDNTSLNNTKAEDDILNYVRAFEDSVDRLKERVDDREAAVVQVREVMNRARDINRFMQRNRLEPAAETDWETIRIGLVRLARSYNVRARL